jgi:hypothetical protein
MNEIPSDQRQRLYSMITGALNMKDLPLYATESEFLNALYDQILDIRHQASMLAKAIGGEVKE